MTSILSNAFKVMRSLIKDIKEYKTDNILLRLLNCVVIFHDSDSLFYRETHAKLGTC